jgi:hypothetical protein
VPAQRHEMQVQVLTESMQIQIRVSQALNTRQHTGIRLLLRLRLRKAT